ncbi:MAG: hypothetical protein WCI04_01870 [archaeon]
MSKFFSDDPKSKKSSKLASSSQVNSVSSSKSASFLEKFSFLKWMDPFTYVDLFVIPKIKRVTNNSAVEFAVNALFALIFAWIIYSALGIAFGTSSPLVIVFSASMEPTLYRGDVMALAKANEFDNFGVEVLVDKNIAGVPVIDYAIPRYSSGQVLTSIYFKDINISVVPKKFGNIVVYNSYPYNLPIIHRAIVKIIALDGNFILTKGDNALTNTTFDADCGAVGKNSSQKPCITFFAIPTSKLQGKAFLTIPKIGCIKLWLFDDLSSLIATGALPRDFEGVC